MNSSVNYRDSYGAAELKNYYQRHLTIGLVASLALHALVIGIYLLGDDPETPSHPAQITLAQLERPRTDTLISITIAPAPPDKKVGHDGGGSPEVKLPPGKASKGHQQARPDKTHNTPDKTRSVNLDVANKMKPVLKEPKRQTVAGNTRDTSRSTGITGTQGQNMKGTGDKPAGGTGGVGVGVATGFGSRGWVVPPRAKFPDGISATGKVVLRFTVLPNGDITAVSAVKRTNDALVNAAIAGLRRAKARPLPADAPQVPQQATIPFTFELR